jgi:hypothetical protein
VSPLEEGFVNYYFDVFFPIVVGDEFRDGVEGNVDHARNKQAEFRLDQVGIFLLDDVGEFLCSFWQDYIQPWLCGGDGLGAVDRPAPSDTMF